MGHYKRIAEYVKSILTQLGADTRTIDLGMVTALLHDIGLSKGDKVDHALESAQIFTKFIDKGSITIEEEDIFRSTILDHSKGNNIKSLIGLSLVLADKLDVTYHRTINSSIRDTMNKEIQKIKKVDINISDNELIVSYMADLDFDIDVLKSWPKAIIIPYKVSKYLKRNYIFLINNKKTDISCFLD